MKRLRPRLGIREGISSYRVKLTHDGQRDERHRQQEFLEQRGCRIGAHPVRAPFDVQEQGGRGQDGQKVDGIRRGEVDEPSQAPGLHALHRQGGHAAQPKKHGGEHRGLTEKGSVTFERMNVVFFQKFPELNLRLSG